MSRDGIRIRVGWFFTILYLVTLVTYLAVQGHNPFELEPGPLGGFLAGAFSPLAVSWFILGYHQQGEELRLNTEALLAQQVELQNQVNETRKLVQINKNEEKRIRIIELEQTLPLLTMGGFKRQNNGTFATFTNQRGDVVSYSFKPTEGFSVVEIFNNDSQSLLRSQKFTIKISPKDVRSGKFELEFITPSGYKNSQNYLCDFELNIARLVDYAVPLEDTV